MSPAIIPEYGSMQSATSLFGSLISNMPSVLVNGALKEMRNEYWIMCFSSVVTLSFFGGVVVIVPLEFKYIGLLGDLLSLSLFSLLSPVYLCIFFSIYFFVLAR